MSKIAIFDYGSGNIFNLKKSIESMGSEVHVISNFNSIQYYDGLFFPGVGNFDPAIKKLVDNKNSKKSFRDILTELPIFGICLGMELLFEKSEEGIENGLDMIEGDVIHLPTTMIVPHMGWNNILIEKQNDLLDGIDNNSWAYFAHSYMVRPKKTEIVYAKSDYGAKIPAIIAHHNLFGTQFHPEKSSVTGIKILQNFLRMCKK